MARQDTGGLGSQQREKVPRPRSSPGGAVTLSCKDGQWAGYGRTADVAHEQALPPPLITITAICGIQALLRLACPLLLSYHCGNGAA